MRAELVRCARWAGSAVRRLVANLSSMAGPALITRRSPSRAKCELKLVERDAVAAVRVKTLKELVKLRGSGRDAEALQRLTKLRTCDDPVSAAARSVASPLAGELSGCCLRCGIAVAHPSLSLSSSR